MMVNGRPLPLLPPPASPPLPSPLPPPSARTRTCAWWSLPSLVLPRRVLTSPTAAASLPSPCCRRAWRCPRNLWPYSRLIRLSDTKCWSTRTSPSSWGGDWVCGVWCAVRVPGDLCGDHRLARCAVPGDLCGDHRLLTCVRALATLRLCTASCAVSPEVAAWSARRSGLVSKVARCWCSTPSNASKAASSFSSPVGERTASPLGRSATRSRSTASTWRGGQRGGGG